ncbi:MAG: cob(I)yrinic acid a,c-diamide adenosyltransferase [Negativicutes bacterium]|nr:cob(I)yrinic acid a,c-diamide adenosyltransferase [Negativicutes bacterium]
MKTGKSEVVIFTGDGKGKTTAALGLAVSAAAKGRRAAVVQFLKGTGYTGELFAQRHLAPHLTIRQFGHGCPDAAAIQSGKQVCRKCGECFRQNRNPDNDYAGQALAFAGELLAQGETDLLVLDEVSHAIRRGLLPAEKVVELISSRPEKTDIVLTGRAMPQELLALADRITECRVVRHPIDSRIDARRGSEY